MTTIAYKQMQYIKFNKTLCGVNFLLNVIDFQSDCPFELSSETQSADFFQIFFIKKADGFLQLNDKRIELEPNTIIFISQHQHHSWHGNFAEMEGQLLLFQDDFLNEFFADQYFVTRLLYFYQTVYPLSISVAPAYLDEHLEKVKEIKEELVFPKSDSVHLIRSILYYSLISLNRTYAKNNKLGAAISLDNTAYQFRQLVEKHIYTHQRVDDYASKMNVSRITLNKAVKAQFNVTAKEFIKLRLLFEIKMKLLHSSKTIAEIAYDFHFSEANHLSRFFKQKTNQTPMTYRLAYQNGSPL